MDSLHATILKRCMFAPPFHSSMRVSGWTQIWCKPLILIKEEVYTSSYFDCKLTIVSGLIAAVCDIWKQLCCAGYASHKMQYSCMTVARQLLAEIFALMSSLIIFTNNSVATSYMYRTCKKKVQHSESVCSAHTEGTPQELSCRVRVKLARL